MAPAAAQLLLSQGWEFQLVAPPGSRGDEDRWLPAGDLPTEIHLDLFRNGIIPDPHLDFNELAVRWVADRQWTYRCRFDSPPEAKGTTHLVFEGLDTFATVCLNGEQILVSDNMFVEHRIDVAGKLRPRTSPNEDAANELTITFDSARKRGLQLVKEHPEHRFIVHQTEVSRGPVRKAQYQWGWDWGPILLTCGPWKPIRLETLTTRIEDARISYRLGRDLSIAHVTVKVRTHGSVSPARCRITLDGENVYSGEPEAGSSTQEFELRFDIKNPRLWWPRGFGKQSTYRLEVALLSHDNDRLDSTSKTIGLRKAELVRENDAFGESFYFRVNDIDIFCGGSCWIPADSFLTRPTPDQYRDWITSHIAEGNQAMVRVWGGGIYEHGAFFDACDEAGVLVWQDFAFACANYPAYPGFLSSVEIEARQSVRRLRHHPSLIIWAGNNEDYQIVERYKLQYDFAADKDPQSWLKTDFPARYIYEHLLPKVLHEEDPGAIYRPSSPWGNGTSTTLVVDPTVGDVHEWDVWHGVMKPHQRLSEMGGRFISEFGMQAYPHVPTMSRAITDPSQRARPGTLALDFRNKAVGHQRRLLAYLGENLDLHAASGPTAASSLEGFTYLTQVVQADTMRSAYGGWRRRWGDETGARRCGGVLVWQLNDCWPTVSWSLVDCDGVRKPAWYTVRDALKPVAVCVRRPFFDCASRPANGHTWQRDTGHIDPRRAWGGAVGAVSHRAISDLWVSNFTTAELEGELKVSFVSIRTGRVLRRLFAQPLELRIQANGTTEVTATSRCNEKQKPSVANKGGDDTAAMEEDSSPFDPTNADSFVIHAQLAFRSAEDKDKGAVRRVHDVSWPDPLKYIDFGNRGVRVCIRSSGDEQGGKHSCVEVSAERPVKCFVFQERPGIRLSDNGFDVLPGYPIRVKVNGCDPRTLKWTYFGQESQEADWDC